MTWGTELSAALSDHVSERLRYDATSRQLPSRHEFPLDTRLHDDGEVAASARAAPAQGASPYHEWLQASQGLNVALVATSEEKRYIRGLTVDDAMPLHRLIVEHSEMAVVAIALVALAVGILLGRQHSSPARSGGRSTECVRRLQSYM